MNIAIASTLPTAADMHLRRHDDEGGGVTSLDEIAHQPMTLGQDLAAVVPCPPLVERPVQLCRDACSIESGITVVPQT